MRQLAAEQDHRSGENFPGKQQRLFGRVDVTTHMKHPGAGERIDNPPQNNDQQRGQNRQRALANGTRLEDQRIGENEGQRGRTAFIGENGKRQKQPGPDQSGTALLRAPLMMLIKAGQAEAERQDEAAVGDEGDREIGVGIQQEQQPGQARGPPRPHQLAVDDGDEKHHGGKPRDVLRVHQRGGIRIELVIQPVSERGHWPPKTEASDCPASTTGTRRSSAPTPTHCGSR